MNQFYRDIFAQPAALRQIAAKYAQPNAFPFLSPPQSAAAPLLTGMGASFHAALVSALHLNSLGIPARAIEAIDLLYYGGVLLSQVGMLIFVSQSGESAEVSPLVGALPTDTTLVAVTNNQHSQLAQRTGIVLPLFAGADETLVATRTYVNTLALLWLLARHWSGTWDGSESNYLTEVSNQAVQLLNAADTNGTRWLHTFAGVSTLVFLGHGPHLATARQAAMMLGEWAKQPALGLGIGAFRHGLIEIMDRTVGVVLFTAPGPGYASTQALAVELESYGAPVLVVESGRTRKVDEVLTPSRNIDEYLSPILDVIPAQLFAEAWARQQGTEGQFRHIGKVIKRL